MGKKRRREADATFGARLRFLRETAKMTQDQLADLAGLADKQTVWQLESGRRHPSFATACALADALGVELEQLR